MTTNGTTGWGRSTERHVRKVRRAHAILGGALLWGAAAAFPAECLWLPNGTGGWESPSRWKDGVKPTQAGDTVVVNGDDVAVLVGESDLGTFQFVSELTVSAASSRVVIDAASDVHTAAAFKGEGQLVKLGANTLYLENLGGPGSTSADCKASIGALTGGLVVSNGVVRAPDRTSAQLHLCKITVAAGGEFRLSTSPSVFVSGGFWGDGVISSDNPSASVNVGGGTRESPAVFSGRFASPFTFNPYGWQYVTGQSEARMSWSLHGVLGVGKMGRHSTSQASASSAGNNESFLFSYSGGVADPTLLLVGATEETTDKELRFSPQLEVGVVDAGAFGGMTFVGSWRISSWASWGESDRMFRSVVLDGENRERPCVLANDMFDSDVSSTYLTKRGTGVWRFNSHVNRKNAGTLEVRRGTVQYESIAEKGVVCSLGTSALTCENVSRTRTVGRVPYAFLLGDGAHAADDAHVATMEYVGAAAASCTSRVFAVNGAARLRATGGSLSLGGVTAAGAGRQTLVLDGAAGRADVASSVTNGPGRLDVVKRGGGTWRLAGSVDVGDVAVEEGTLAMGCDACAYYRFSICQTTGTNDYAYCSGIALYDAAGQVANGTLGTLGVNRDKIGRPELLAPGEVTLDGDYWDNGGNDDPVSNWFAYDASTGVIGSTARLAESKRPIVGDPDSWYKVYFRLPADAPPVAAYDIKSAARAYAGPDSTMLERCEIEAWALEGSVDGVHWTFLDRVAENPNPPTEANQWYSRGPGFAVEERPWRTTLGLESLSVAAGATVEVCDDVEVSFGRITYDSAGCGTLAGGRLADVGEVIVVGEKTSTPPEFVLDGVRNADAVANWKVWYKGKETARMSVRRTATGFVVNMKPGLAVFVR